MNKEHSSRQSNKPWAWIPSLYLFQSIPFYIVNLTSVVIYKTMGVSISSIAFWTSLLYLPWTIKLLWSPVVDSISTKRNWVLFTQFLIALTIVLVGLSFQTINFYPISISLFLLLAFLSASHDISADGFYMLSLSTHQQAFFVGIRNSFNRIGRLLSIGAITLLVGFLLDRSGLPPATFEVHATSNETHSNALSLDSSKIQNKKLAIVCTPSLVPISLWTKGESDSASVFISLSKAPADQQTIVATVNRIDGSPEIDLSKKETGRFEFNRTNWNVPKKCRLIVDHNLKHPAQSLFKVSAGNVGFSWTISVVALGILLLLIAIYHYFILPVPEEAIKERKAGGNAYVEVFTSFFTKSGTAPALFFFLFYRLGESQLVKVTPVFLIDQHSAGGLGLTTSQFGLAYGTLGILCLVLGGILGGLAAAKWGLKKMIGFMAMGMNLPILLYVYMAYVQPQAGSLSIYVMIGLEEMGYGFGFTAYMLYMLHYVGESKFKTAEYAIGTSLMALGMMLPGMISGKMVEWMGYEHFFIYVFICQMPGLLCLRYLKIDPAFGKKDAH